MPLRTAKNGRVPQPLIDPIDRTLSIYRLEAGHYGHATVLELKGRTQLNVIDGVAIDWDRVLAKVS